MTRDYDAFCRGAFGGYLQHTPRRQMDEPTSDSVANTLHQLRGAPVGPGSWAMVGAVPLLFAIDRELHVRDGYFHDAASLEQVEQRRRMLESQHASPGAYGGGESSSTCSPGDGCGDGGGSCGGGGGGCGGGGCGGG